MTRMQRVYRTIRSFFIKKKIKFLGRTGLIFSEEEEKYFIDSELLNSEEFELVIYKKEIYLIRNSNKILLVEEENKKVLLKILDELGNMGLRVIVK